MDFMSLLKKIGPLVQAGSQVAGKAAEGRAKGRSDEADLNVKRDMLAQQGYSTAQNAQFQAGNQDLQRKSFEEEARGSRAKQAAIADMLANFKGTSISTPGVRQSTISGGLNVNTPGVQQAMAKMREQALLAQLKGDTPGGEGFTGGNILTAPKQTPLPQAGKMDGILGALGTYGGLAGSLMGLGGDSEDGYAHAEDMPAGSSSQQAIADNIRRFAGNVKL